ncbi:hypothetical protein NEOLI_002070 [Neolecta irregularis DAH-3]|uniref:Uncharacterized protein n=1 Tax=Neolecta irregularis (strain DAH-3) TaxID=1198029 RepID=A0A1U7LSM9_NEOID|nr:hypothetical protein NEOLI_002070 [Neolecta irregularis DAH-3]|eukprot:OLL25667.1 hypothetical protein NEOLI_002070 [Neolecta irregularis DAH-3]
MEIPVYMLNISYQTKFKRGSSFKIIARDVSSTDYWKIFNQTCPYTLLPSSGIYGKNYRIHYNLQLTAVSRFRDRFPVEICSICVESLQQHHSLPAFPTFLKPLNKRFLLDGIDYDRKIIPLHRFLELTDHLDFWLSVQQPIIAYRGSDLSISFGIKRKGNRKLELSSYSLDLLCTLTIPDKQDKCASVGTTRHCSRYFEAVDARIYPFRVSLRHLTGIIHIPEDLPQSISLPQISIQYDLKVTVNLTNLYNAPVIRGEILPDESFERTIAVIVLNKPESSEKAFQFMALNPTIKFDYLKEPAVQYLNVADIRKSQRWRFHRRNDRQTNADKDGERSVQA